MGAREAHLETASVYQANISGIFAFVSSGWLTRAIVSCFDQKNLGYSKAFLYLAIRFQTWLWSHKANMGANLEIPFGEKQEKKRTAIDFQEMLEIATATVRSNQERRIRAAACFWYLSGVRIGAFISLRLSTIDIEDRGDLQISCSWELGLRTAKRAKTCFRRYS